MADVQVTVGADITPFKAAMAQVQATAKSATEAAGIEIGNRTGFRDEQRFTRGIDAVTRSLANAKDPLQAFSGALEGLSQSFRITGSVFAGFAIGDFLRDQLTKAAESASDFYDKTSQIFAVGNDSSREFAQEAVKNFQEAEEAYGKEGFLEKLIFGKGQEQTLENARAKVAEVKQQLAEENAQIIRDQTAEIGADPLEKANAEQDLLRDEYKKKIADAASDDEKVALREQLDAKLADVDRKYFSEQAKLGEEQSRKEQEEVQKKQQYAKDLADEKQKQDKLAAEGESPVQKLADLQKELDWDKSPANPANWTDALSQAKNLTHEMELQNEITRTSAEIQRKKVEDAEKGAELSRKYAEAQQGVASALENASIFHGTSSSLHKVGLGGTAVQNNTEQLKELKEQTKRLDDVKLEIMRLNDNLQST